MDAVESDFFESSTRLAAYRSINYVNGLCNGDLVSIVSHSGSI